jgi:hypothetical protein
MPKRVVWTLTEKAKAYLARSGPSTETSLLMENKLLRAELQNVKAAWQNLWEKAGRPAGAPEA